LVHEDPLQPRCERPLRVEALERAEGPHERLLREVVRAGPTPGGEERPLPGERPGALVERPERVVRALGRLLEERGVVGSHGQRYGRSVIAYPGPSYTDRYDTQRYDGTKEPLPLRRARLRRGVHRPRARAARAEVGHSQRA